MLNELKRQLAIKELEILQKEKEILEFDIMLEELKEDFGDKNPIIQEENRNKMVNDTIEIVANSHIEDWKSIIKSIEKHNNTTFTQEEKYMICNELQDVDDWSDKDKNKFAKEFLGVK